jgi:hypothetical protein
MAQIIIYEQNGQVAVCYSTGELSIEEVLAKDCPVGAIIVDDSELPQGDDANYFDAWELIDGIVVVNETKKQAIIDKAQAIVTAKESAIVKLSALGLTADEISALGA